MIGVSPMWSAALRRPSAGVPAGVFRWADALNAIARTNQTITAGRLNVTWRRQVVIGSGDRNGLRWLPTNFAQLTTAVGLPGNAVTIVKLALERNSPAAYAPITWGGQRSITLANGESDAQQSDTLLPSAFGLAQFTVGDTYWLRGQISVAADGLNYPANGLNANVSGEIAIGWGTGATISDVDGTGSLGWSGTNFGSVSIPQIGMLIGSFSGAEAPTITGMGDSIAQGQNNTAVGRDHAGGLFIKSLFASDGTSSPIAGCALVIAGCQYTPFASDANRDLLLRLFRYGKYAFDEMGTNDINVGGTASSVLALAKGVYAQLRAQHGVYLSGILRTKLLCYTTSVADLDFANQIKAAKWQSGADVDTLNSTWGSTGGANTVIDTHTPIADGTDPWIWATGMAGEASSPKTHLHPAPAGYTAACVPIRAAFTALT